MSGCGTNGGNPNTPCNNQEGIMKKPFLFKKGFAFDTLADALNQSKWIDAIQNKDIIPLPSIINRESANEGAVYEQTPYGSLPVRDGRWETKILIASNSDLHKRLRTLKSSGEYSFCYAFASGLIKVYQPVGTTKVKAFSTQIVNPEYQTPNDGSVGSKTPIHITLKNPTEHEDNAIILAPDWDPEDLDALMDTTITVVSSINTKVVVDVALTHINNKVQTSNPVNGLVVGDFQFLKASDGTVQTITTITADPIVQGRYALNGTGFVTGPVSFKAPSVMATKGYESVAAVTATI